MFDLSKVSIDRLNHPLLDLHAVSLSVLRLDQIDPLISGNKWFKLRPALQGLKPGDRVLSFGGAHSNHLHALAWAGQQLGLHTIGIVRQGSPDSPTLVDLRRWGMQLHFVDRELYRRKTEPDLLAHWARHFADPLIVPEGGSDVGAVSGCREIWNLPALRAEPIFDQLYVACGSGATLAGLLVGAPRETEVIGVSPFHDLADLRPRIEHLLQCLQLSLRSDFKLETALPLRFARLNAELAAFHWLSEQRFGLTLDPVYTLRVLYHIFRKLVQRQIPAGARILMIHTGGLQGLRAQQSRISHLASAQSGPLHL